MANLIEIEVNINSPDAVTFPKLLKEIENIGKILNWSILELDAVGNLGDNKSLSSYEEEIYQSPRGKIIEWSQLVELSKKLHQVAWMTLVAVDNIEKIKKSTIEAELFSNHEIVIEMIDWGLWAIYSKNELLIKHLARVFKPIKYETISIKQA